MNIIKTFVWSTFTVLSIIGSNFLEISKIINEKIWLSISDDIGEVPKNKKKMYKKKCMISKLKNVIRYSVLICTVKSSLYTLIVFVCKSLFRELKFNNFGGGFFYSLILKKKFWN